MASNSTIKGITIQIEGNTSPLTKSLSDAQGSIQKTSQAMKDLDKALQVDPNNIELLTQKQELLEKQIAQTSDKLETMRKVAEDANDALARGDISQEQYAQLTAEIVKTEASLNDLNTKAEDNAQAMQDVEDGVDGASSEMEELDTASEEAGHSLDGLKVVAEAVGGAMAAAFAAAVAGAKEVGEALISATVDAGNYVDEINTLSQKTGVSTETLQEWNYVSGLIDVDVNTLTGSLTKLEKSMDKARDGSGDVADAYAQLGVSVTDADGNLRDAETVMFEVLEAMSQLPEGADRDLLAMQLLGKSAKELGPLLQDGAIDNFKALSEEAHSVGYVLEGETFDAFQNFDDQMERFSKSGEAAKRALGTVLLPTLDSLAGSGTSALNKFTKAMKDADGDISKLGPAVSGILQDLLGEVNKVAPDLFSLIGTIMQTLLQILIDNLPLILDSAMQIITTLTETLLAPENLAKIISSATTIILTLVQYLLDNIGMILDAAIQIILTVVQGITQALPELIPATVDAILTIVDTLLAPENLTMILDAGMQLLVGLTTGLLDALPQLIERLPEIIIGVTEWLLSADGIGKIIETGFQLFVALVEKTPEIIVELCGAVGEMISGIVGAVLEEGPQIFEQFQDIFFSIIDNAATWGADIISGIIDGIGSMCSSLTDTLGDVAGTIADWIGFSCPSIGPLSDWDIRNPGADMVDLFAEGIDSEMPELQQSIDMMANTMTGADTTSPDYTGQLSSINSNIAALGSGGQVVIPVYIGQDRIETIVAQANTNLSYLSGGR